MLVKQIPQLSEFRGMFYFQCVFFFFTLLQSCLNESEPLLSWQLDVLRRFGGGGVLFIHFHITFFVRWLLVQLNHQRSFFTLENRFEIFQYFHFRMKNEKKRLLFFKNFQKLSHYHYIVLVIIRLHFYAAIEWVSISPFLPRLRRIRLSLP